MDKKLLNSQKDIIQKEVYFYLEEYQKVLFLIFNKKEEDVSIF